MRYDFWHIFVLFALALIFLRVRASRHANWRDPVVLAFSLGLFLGATGTLSKQPVLAGSIDSFLGLNAAWIVADGLFLIGLCAGTFWVDLMRLPVLREKPWRLLRQSRVIILLAVLLWMVTTATREAAIFGTLERGGIDVGGSGLLLSARLVYFVYSVWALSYISLHFYKERSEMRDRFNYIRLTIPWAGITLAITAPLLQTAATLEGFVAPALLPVIWSPVWAFLSAIQIVVASLVIITFFPPAYKSVSWLDKQMLVHRLNRTCRAVAKSRPDLASASLPGRTLITRQPDTRLAGLVTELEMVRSLMGQPADEIEVSAGGVMPDAARLALKGEQSQFLRGLQSEKTMAARVTGEPYALARWYAAVGSKI